MKIWEQARVARHVLLDENYMKSYHRELFGDPDPAQQWRVTRRAILACRMVDMDEEDLEGRLAWICDPERWSCPVPVLDGPGAAQDEARLLWLQLLRDKPDRWLREHREQLRRSHPQATALLCHR